MSVFNDDVLLVHIPKTGGSSARDYMLAHLPGAHDSLAEGGPLPIDSIPLRHIEEYTGRPLDSWERIIIPVRNPYAQNVSQWAYWADRFAVGGRHIHDRAAALHKTLAGWLMDPHSDFRVWYESAVRGMDLNEAVQHVNQWGYYEYFITVDGEVPENVTIVHCENLSKEFPQAIAKFVGGYHPMPHANTSPHQEPGAYYNNVAFQIVEDRFRWAFEHFYEKVA